MPLVGPITAMVGELAEAGERLFYIGQLVPLRIVAEIDEEDIPKVEIGQNVLVPGPMDSRSLVVAGFSKN